MSSPPARAAAPALLPSKEVDRMFCSMLRSAIEDFLIHSARNLIIPSALSVSRELDAAAVNVAAPTEVYIHLARPRDQRVSADCHQGGAFHGGGAVGARAGQAKARSVLSATKWGRAVSVSTGRQGMELIPVGDVLTMLKENSKPPTQVSSLPSSQPPFFFPFLQRTVSGMTDCVAVDCAASSYSLSEEQVAVVAAVHEHVRNITDTLEARFILLKGVTLVMAPDVDAVKNAPSAQVFVRKM